MKSLRMAVIAFLLVASTAFVARAQEDKPSVVPMASSKFGALPVTPPCLTLSAQKGDPSKEAATILIKMTAGCSIPWHWHTANESLMFVRGAGKLEMKNEAEAAHNVGPGDFVFLPSKHVHQFTCTAACTFFDQTSAAFDLHYVDKDGKEIPPEQALKSNHKPAAAKKK